MYDFTEKRVVVTGGNSGIGKTIARRFVEAGAKVLICARSEDSLKTVAEEIGAAHHVCDISDWQSTKDLADAAVERLGGVHIGVNSAGIEEKFMLKEHPPGHLEKMVSIQFTGAVYFMQHISNVMSGGGAIVNISSLTGTIVAPGNLNYTKCPKGSYIPTTTRIRRHPSSQTCCVAWNEHRQPKLTRLCDKSSASCLSNP